MAPSVVQPWCLSGDAFLVRAVSCEASLWLHACTANCNGCAWLSAIAGESDSCSIKSSYIQLCTCRVRGCLRAIAARARWCTARDKELWRRLVGPADLRVVPWRLPDRCDYACNVGVLPMCMHAIAPAQPDRRRCMRFGCEESAGELPVLAAAGQAHRSCACLLVHAQMSGMRSKASLDSSSAWRGFLASGSDWSTSTSNSPCKLAAQPVGGNLRQASAVLRGQLMPDANVLLRVAACMRSSLPGIASEWHR